MTEDELVAHRVADISKVKLAFLFTEHGVEEDLFEYVAAFLLDFVWVALDEGLAEFIDFLDGVLADGLVGLLGIPRAVFTESLHHAEGTCKGCELLFKIWYFEMLFHYYIRAHESLPTATACRLVSCNIHRGQSVPHACRVRLSALRGAHKSRRRS